MSTVTSLSSPQSAIRPEDYTFKFALKDGHVVTTDGLDVDYANECTINEDGTEELRPRALAYRDQVIVISILPASFLLM